jgi:hypothetical protein
MCHKPDKGLLTSAGLESPFTELFANIIARGNETTTPIMKARVEEIDRDVMLRDLIVRGGIRVQTKLLMFQSGSERA